MVDTILSARNLRKTYVQKAGMLGLRSNTIHALADVSLDVPRGKTLAVVGESGSGKSTLARCLLQLLPLDAGSVVFEGNEITRLSAKALSQMRKHFQVVFQDPFASLNPRMKVREIVAEGLLVHGIGDHEQRRNKVLKMLERVGLSSSDMDKYPHQFSGGQRQRIGIARALVLEPKLVICDEPVSALDVSIQAQILLLLKALQKEMGLSYLFISHDLRVVRHMADKVMVMQHGKVVEQGEVEQIFSSPQHVYTQQLLNSLPGRHWQNV